MRDTVQDNRRGPQRILHVLGTLERGGIQTWLWQALPIMAKESYRFDFCTYRADRGAYATDLEHRGCRLHYIPLGSSPPAILKFAKRFRNLLREGRYDVVHCHALLLVGVVLVLAWMEGTPVRIAHAHSTNRNTGWMYSAANRLGIMLSRLLTRASCTHGIGCSTEAAATLFGRRWREDPKYSLIYCGIDLKPFEIDCNPNSVRAALGIAPGARVIGHVGSFSIAKNHRFLLEVTALVLQYRRDVVLLLVGDGTLRPAIMKTCAALGIVDRVIFAGETSRVPELMRCAMDVFVMPSLHEALPLVLLEAQAAGLPCLVSNVVPHEAMISDGAIQFLPLESGAKVWAENALSLLQNNKRQPHVLLQMADSDFNVVASAKHLEDLYSSAMTKQCSARNLSRLGVAGVA
jgi:glycosyltransferase involved in cell wall biosynthesis